ncbi:hypothetical protein KR51_00021330 [Rubidibacter lacunae KORDI 51-2]|uniref:Uncharacterized protein n=1 Tax=Rubidibacter lacunae KORDI 51-2 TaxID=582515 RepID=U5DNG2_9CHRO|nr:hypothetical protein KR51_00021330 [Rubidibacter lacunae KORDI 51-2]
MRSLFLVAVLTAGLVLWGWRYGVFAVGMAIAVIGERYSIYRSREVRSHFLNPRHLANPKNMCTSLAW